MTPIAPTAAEGGQAIVGAAGWSVVELAGEIVITAHALDGRPLGRFATRSRELAQLIRKAAGALEGIELARLLSGKGDGQ